VWTLAHAHSLQYNVDLDTPLNLSDGSLHGYLLSSADRIVSEHGMFPNLLCADGSDCCIAGQHPVCGDAWPLKPRLRQQLSTTPVCEDDG
jgi:hypothetical protein